MKQPKRLLLAAIFVLVTAWGCQSIGQREAYTPGLGELMTLQQLRHAKLWLAGNAGNWELAAYEVDELAEGFADVVAFHPTHKDTGVAIAELSPALMDRPLADLRGAIAARDPRRFTVAFDGLTSGCNTCHVATQFGFNKVTRPAGSAFLNQDFAAP